MTTPKFKITSYPLTREHIVGSVLLIGGNEVLAVDGWAGLHLEQVWPQLILQTDVQDTSDFAGFGNVSRVDVPALRNERLEARIVKL